jgi:hypothetical protein
MVTLLFQLLCLFFPRPHPEDTYQTFMWEPQMQGESTAVEQGIEQ